MKIRFIHNLILNLRYYYELLCNFKRKSINDHLLQNRLIWRSIAPSNILLHEKNKMLKNKIKTSRYEIWNFLPICLFEQFKKQANLYFLILIIILVCLGRESPISPATTLLPLIIVITLSGLKQGYEDYQRKKNDNFVNNRIIEKLDKDIDKRSIKAQDIKIGDIIRINNNEEFPCDMVLLSSSNNNGISFITTASFDGETNLKARYSVPETNKMSGNDQLTELSCLIECDHPNENLYQFNGRFKTFYRHTNPIESSLNSDNFLLRGAILRNTNYIYGIAVYVGLETKIALNQKIKRRKISNVDEKLDKYNIAIIIILLIASGILTFVLIIKKSDNLITNAYQKNFFNIFKSFTMYVSLLNSCIPISLYVTIEIQKFINSCFICWDISMYNPKTDDAAIVNISDTIEELGQVEYIFSDKTGTLTENKMNFVKCVINNTIYTMSNNSIVNTLSYNSYNMNQEMINFFTYICICHTADCEIITEDNETKMHYKSYSADEVSLLEASNKLGIKFKNRHNDELTIEINSIEYKYKILHILEFDPDRKRMSVIYTNSNNEYYLICKGADSSVIPLCNSSLQRESILENVNKLATDGFRTLVISYKLLTKLEYEQANKLLNEARLTIINRDKMLKLAYETIECDLNLIGITGVEDKLQSGVIDTFKDFQLAHIKIWVLTGDKEETAVNISLKCGHITNEMDILYLCRNSDDISNNLTEYIERMKLYPEKEYALVIDGYTFDIVMKNHINIVKEIFIKSTTALFCRMSPLQKSQVVHFVRTQFPNHPITLAVGDGANDCSMIQEAHIGIGIIGKEGRQAVYSSDFAIQRFRYLRKLLIYHGYNFYNRITTTILYFFYKSLLFCTPIFLFIWYADLSEVTLFDDVEVTMYNTLITSFPVLFYGIFEQPISKKSIMKNPQYYTTLRNNNNMKWKMFILWNLNAIWQGCVIFFTCIIIYNDGYVNIENQF